LISVQPPWCTRPAVNGLFRLVAIDSCNSRFPSALVCRWGDFALPVTQSVTDSPRRSSQLRRRRTIRTELAASTATQLPPLNVIALWVEDRTVQHTLVTVFNCQSAQTLASSTHHHHRHHHRHLWNRLPTLHPYHFLSPVLILIAHVFFYRCHLQGEPKKCPNQKIMIS